LDIFAIAGYASLQLNIFAIAGYASLQLNIFAVAGYASLQFNPKQSQVTPRCKGWKFVHSSCGLRPGAGLLTWYTSAWINLQYLTIKVNLQD
jgi:hypothetical protein